MNKRGESSRSEKFEAGLAWTEVVYSLTLTLQLEGLIHIFHSCRWIRAKSIKWENWECDNVESWPGLGPAG